MTAADPADARDLMDAFNQQIIDEFRANEGKVGGGFAGAPMVLLTTTGAKSGRRRTSPLVFGREGDTVYVIASKGGAPSHPAWYHNILAHPEVTVELGAETYEARAEAASEPERTRLFDQIAAAMPAFAEYQQKTSRVIPVVVLHRV